MTPRSSRLGEQHQPIGRSTGALVATCAAALVMLVGAVAVVISSTDRDRPATAAEAAPGEALPLDLATIAAATAVHYIAAEADPATYRDVPCFCGCENFLGHRHLYDCFVRADGRGWEAHAAGCGVCIAESITVRELREKGHDTWTIREEIIAQYGATIPTTVTSRS